MTDFTRTEAAIKHLDKLQARFTIGTVARMKGPTVRKKEAELLAAEEAVGIAFGEDTKGFNDPFQCRSLIRAGPRKPPVGGEESFVRRIVRQWRESQN
jgi:hypothetical protein